ncbi:MAG: hypothetical protein K9N35_03050 [Candidatus Marinimicrobia bacterium]|nr:hypothetical protein [Candidatus Neomarinimicrobiota bacterium]
MAQSAHALPGSSRMMTDTVEVTRTDMVLRDLSAVASAKVEILEKIGV